MRPVAKLLHFPLGGVARNLSYRDTNRHREDGMYPTPNACNVWPSGPFESRLRGGSRPGLVAFDGSLGGVWCWPNGEPVYWPDGESKIIYGDGVGGDSRTVDPHRLYQPSATIGDAPQNITCAAFHRARLAVAEGNAIYVSRSGNIHDFDYGADMDDVGRAAVLSLADADVVGEPITALAGVNDRLFYAATANSLWLIRADLVSGERSCVSGEVGIAGPNAWCWDGSKLIFLSPRGLYTLDSGEGNPLWHEQGVKPVSPNRVPAELLGQKDAILAYDPYWRGVFIFLPSGNHWFLDDAAGGLWPFRLADGFVPTSVLRVKNESREYCVFVGANGSRRTFSKSATTDMGTSFGSFVDIGPFSLNQSTDSGDAMLAEVTATLAEDSSASTLTIRAGRAAESAYKATTALFSADLSKGWHHVLRPRLRGVWFVLRIYSESQWAYESLEVVGRQLGRLR